MIIENQFYFEQKFVKLVKEVFNENSYELNKILREKQSIEGWITLNYLSESKLKVSI